MPDPVEDRDMDPDHPAVKEIVPRTLANDG